MTKHTAGPWTLRGQHPWVVQCPTNIPEIVGTVCEVGYKPNALLIAAAPDLLAACNDALHGLRIDAPERVDEIDALEAAIAKAEGKP